jgi:mannose-6-phosphate isomerase-like protein (cupin superfamily)
LQVVEQWSSARTTPLPPATLKHILAVAKRNTLLRSDVVRTVSASAEADRQGNAAETELLTASSSEDFDDCSAPVGSHELTRHSGPGPHVASHVMQQQLQAQLVQLLQFSRLLRSRLGVDSPQPHAHGSSSAAPDDAARVALPASACAMTKVSLSDAPSFQLPNQENRLALVMDPYTCQCPFTFGVEIFPPGHKTTPHVHDTAHEMFFIVSGSGEAFCNGSRFRVGAGDTIVFPPGCTHGIDADEGQPKLYCLELMLPNEQFSEFVRAGQRMEGLGPDDMCILAAIGCQ